jgi:hypothetical protein
MLKVEDRMVLAVLRQRADAFRTTIDELKAGRG